MIQIESYVLLKDFQTNTYLLFDAETKESFLIDPAAPDPKLAESINNRGLHLKMVIITHGHGDHIGGTDYFTKFFSCPVACHPDDVKMLMDGKKNLSVYMGMELRLQAPEILLDENSSISLGKHAVKVIHTPGHTRGSICLWVDKFLVSGDTLFEQSIGRTDLPGGDHASIVSSIKNKLYILPEDVLVYPGHGPATSIGLEKATNPFVRG